MFSFQSDTLVFLEKTKKQAGNNSSNKIEEKKKEKKKKLIDIEHCHKINFRLT